MIWKGGWSYLLALKVLFEHKDNLEFQEAVRYAIVLSRTAELLGKDGETPVFFRSVGDLITYFKNIKGFKKSNEWRKIINEFNNDDLTAIFRILPLIPETKNIPSIEEKTDELINEMKSFLPSNACPEI